MGSNHEKSRGRKSRATHSLSLSLPRLSACCQHAYLSISLPTFTPPASMPVKKPACLLRSLPAWMTACDCELGCQYPVTQSDCMPVCRSVSIQNAVCEYTHSSLYIFRIMNTVGNLHCMFYYFSARLSAAGQCGGVPGCPVCGAALGSPALHAAQCAPVLALGHCAQGTSQANACLIDSTYLCINS